MLPPITSLQNPKIKNLVKLRQRRQRDRQKRMLIDGARALGLALKNGFAVETVYFAPELAGPAIIEQARRQNIPLQPVTPAVFQKISYGDNAAEGVLGLAPQPSFSLNRLPVPPNALYLIVEGLEKPGNVGAILRSADAAGVTGLVLCDSQTDIYNPNVIRASRGACFTVPLAGVSVGGLLLWLHENHIQVLAADPTAGQLYTQADMRPSTALVLGAEHAGLTDVWHSHPLLRIPMAGQVDSLNVAQTASILLFEAVRQRTTAPGPAPRRQ